jgi:translocation and assembly module TamA
MPPGTRAMGNAAIRRLTALRIRLAALTAATALSCALAARAADAPLAGPAPGNAPRVEIEAPAPVRALLTRYLDLIRLTQLRSDESLDDSEWTRVVAAAPGQARELLKTEGYFEPQVSAQRLDGSPVRVRLVVDPGPRVHVGSVAAQVVGPLAERAAARDASALALSDALQHTGPLRPGDVFRNADWTETKLQWLAALRSSGHAAPRLVDSRAEVDVATATARLQGTLDSGPLFLAGPLSIEGLSRQDAATVHLLAGFGPGAPLTETLLLDYQDRLQKAGLFDGVSVTFNPLPEQAAATPVTVRLHELPLQQATVGIGASTDTGARATLEHVHRRPFGWDLTASNKIEWGQQAQRWQGDLLTHPGEGNRRKLLGVLIDRERSDTDVVLSQRVRLGLTQDTPRIERLAFAEVLRSRQSIDDGPVHDARALSGNLHLVLRRLDNALLPTQGYSLSLQLGLGRATSNDAESGPYARLYARLTGYWPLGSNWYARGRVEAGQIIKRDTVAVPDALGFRAGGDDSVRGYAYRTLAPAATTTGVTGSAGSVVSGTSLLTTSAELAHPLFASMPSLWGAVFVDAGRAGNGWSGFKPAVGYGVGVRWRSPIGPLHVDLAWGEEVRKLRLHLMVGVTY